MNTRLSTVQRGCRTIVRRLVGSALCALFVGALSVPGMAVAHAQDYQRIHGSGSTWSQGALDQWVKDVRPQGISVDYTGGGSSAGRQNFYDGTVSFAVSEIPYGLSDSGNYDQPPKRKFAYMPIVAGGTAFMYNLHIGAARVTNLRLSGENITKIFTGVLTSWADPAIAADNPGLTLPDRRIIPVVRSDGSGATAQFTTWMSKQFSSLWDAYCGHPNCGFTSYFPYANGSSFVAQDQSLGVSGYITQAAAEGAIGYDEYSYALTAGFPVVKVLNAAGYYIEPTDLSVAVALTQADINDDTTSALYLTQNLDRVYGYSDKRTYPLSSYSYMILPTETSDSFNEKQGYTLGDFAYYFLCSGQSKMHDLGYSPLPRNLVQAGFEQIRKIPGVDPQTFDITRCNNPTFESGDGNRLAEIAPQPKDCDAKGPSQCPDGTAGDKSPTVVSGPAGGVDDTGSSGTGTTPSGGGDSAATTPGAGDPGAATGSTVTGQGSGTGATTTAGGKKPAGTGAAPATPTASGAAAPALVAVTNPDTGETQLVPATSGANGTTSQGAKGGPSAAGGGNSTGAASGLSGAKSASTGASGATSGSGSSGGPAGADAAAGQHVATADGATTQLAYAQPVSLHSPGTFGQQDALMFVAGAMLVALVLLPPILARALTKRAGR